MKKTSEMGVVLRGQRNQCAGCGELFNSTHAFEKHRTGEMSARRCLTSKEMVEKGMVKKPSGFWVGSEWEPDVAFFDNKNEAQEC